PERRMRRFKPTLKRCSLRLPTRWKRSTKALTALAIAAGSPSAQRASKLCPTQPSASNANLEWRACETNTVLCYGDSDRGVRPGEQVDCDTEARAEYSDARNRQDHVPDVYPEYRRRIQPVSGKQRFLHRDCSRRNDRSNFRLSAWTKSQP